MSAVKKILLNIDIMVFCLFLCSFFSILGAFIIYFNPDVYNSIDFRPLFKWLYYNQTIKNFWLYLVIIFFAYLGCSGLLCVLNDIKRKNVFSFLFHISFIMMLIAHLINCYYYFKIPEYIIPEGFPKTINLPISQKPLNVFLDKLRYDITPENFPANIKAELIYLENDEEKRGVLSINKPLKIGSFYLVLKQISPFLRSITFKLRSEDRLIIPVLTLDRPVVIDDVVFEFIAHNEDMSMYKIMVNDGSGKKEMLWYAGQNVNIKGKNYTITRIIPDTIGSIVVDIVYDPSLPLLFIASTIFVLSSVFRFFKKM